MKIPAPNIRRVRDAGTDSVAPPIKCRRQTLIEGVTQNISDQFGQRSGAIETAPEKGRKYFKIFRHNIVTFPPRKRCRTLGIHISELQVNINTNFKWAKAKEIGRT